MYSKLKFENGAHRVQRVRQNQVTDRYFNSYSGSFTRS
ncbi:PCRF domain-containing protein [Staphylococcus aureus]